MTARTTVATIATGVVLAVFAVPAAQAAPGQMSSEAYQALHMRSFALNVIYGLGKPAEMTHAQYRASLIRSTALNERYGLPVALTSDQVARLYGTGRTTSPDITPPASTTVPRVDAFDWSDAAIGAAFTAGLALIGALGVLVVSRRQVPHLRH